MSTFRDLRVWQEAKLLAHEADDVADRLPRKVAHLSDQLRRASASIPTNIAEGSGKSSRREFVRYPDIARASLRETESHVELVRGKYVAPADLASIDRRLANVGRLLSALIASLRSEPP